MSATARNRAGRSGKKTYRAPWPVNAPALRRMRFQPTAANGAGLCSTDEGRTGRRSSRRRRPADTGRQWAYRDREASAGFGLTVITCGRRLHSVVFGRSRTATERRFDLYRTLVEASDIRRNQLSTEPIDVKGIYPRHALNGRAPRAIRMNSAPYRRRGSARL